MEKPIGKDRTDTPHHLKTEYPLCEKDEQAKTARKAQEKTEKALGHWREIHREDTNEQHIET